MNNKGVQKTILQLRNEIEATRGEYQVLVDNYYNSDIGNPFPVNRERSKKNIKQDCEKMQEIIEHSLIAGDRFLFEKYIITPLSKKSLPLSSNDTETVYGPYIKSMINKFRDRPFVVYYLQEILKLL